MQNIILQIIQRDTKNYSINLTKKGIPQDISGWTLTFVVKKNFNDADINAVIFKSIIIPNDTESQNGRYNFTLSSTDTDLPNDEYWYDLKFIDGDMRETFARGKLLIIPSILGE